jgi:amino acid transporter
MDFTTGLTITVSVVLAVVGYIATYVYGLRLAQRKDRLDRVNRQLSEFYGPLLALVSASQSSWEAFRGRYRPVPRSFWSDDPPPTAEDQAIWRLWVTEVFMPLNLEMVDVVTHHADLLDERQMPPGLLTLCAHVASYKPVVKQWEKGDFTEHTAVINFPSAELLLFASEGYSRIKMQQSDLLGPPKPLARSSATWQKRGRELTPPDS